MTENNEPTEGEEESRTLSERIGVRADRGRLSRWKQLIPYPNGVDMRSRTLELTVNSEWLRPKLHALRHYNLPRLGKPRRSRRGGCHMSIHLVYNEEVTPDEAIPEEYQ